MLITHSKQGLFHNVMKNQYIFKKEHIIEKKARFLIKEPHFRP